MSRTCYRGTQLHLDGNRRLTVAHFTAVFSHHGKVRCILYNFWGYSRVCVWCFDASTFTEEHENHQTSNLNMKYSGEHNKRQCPDHRQAFAANSGVCVFSSHVFWTSYSLEVPAGVTQDFSSIYLPSAVRAFIFSARRIQPFLSLVDREVELRKNPTYRDGFELTSQCVRRLRG